MSLLIPLKGRVCVKRDYANSLFSSASPTGWPTCGRADCTSLHYCEGGAYTRIAYNCHLVVDAHRAKQAPLTALLPPNGLHNNHGYFPRTQDETGASHSTTTSKWATQQPWLFPTHTVRNRRLTQHYYLQMGYTTPMAISHAQSQWFSRQ
jgi:hypothetical protein